jgi:hypothetical protein
MGFVTGMATGGPLAKGLMEGFKKAGGSEAFASIIRNTFALLGKLLLDIVKAAPMETLFIAGLLTLPAVISGLISAAITAVLSRGLPGLLQNLMKVRAVSVKDLGKTTPITDPRRMLPAAKGVAGALPGSGKAAAGIGKNLSILGLKLKGLAKIVPGLNIAFAGLDFTLGKMAGEDTTTAASSALGGLVGGTAGAALGTAIAPGIGTAIGGVLGTILGDWIGKNLPAFLAGIPAQLTAAWNSFKVWFTNLPMNLGYALGAATANMEMAWQTFVKWWNNLVVEFRSAMNRVGWQLRAIWEQLKKTITQIFTGKFDWAGLASSLTQTIWNIIKSGIDGVKNLASGIGNWFSGLGKGFEAGRRETFGGYKSTATQQREAGGVPISPIFTSSAKGSLGDAVAKEMKMKPPGSNLVVANSSETVIPAAGGHGMEAFIGTMRAGFNSIVQTYLQVQQKQEATLKQINSTLVSNQQQTNTRLSTLETKFSSPSMGGLGGGSIGGGVDSFTGMAQKFGLQMTSGYRPGDPGWHGANRARDYSNGTGPTPQMMQFAQALASNYGSNLKELIYTPLGFSIKNGQKVPPYATAGHYNHVHVAYANGIGQGMAFNSLKGAQAWENSMVKGSVKVGSVTANSGEGFGGGPVNVTNNISISQQPGQSADELAAIVAMKIGEAVADARAASIFV